MLLVPVLFMAVMYVLDREPALDLRMLRTTVLGLPSESDRMPALVLPAAQELPLPDVHLRDSAGPSSIWYQVSIEKPSSVDGTWALFIPWVRGNFAAYVNGERVGESAPMLRPYAEFRTPLYFEFPASLLRAGPNEIQLRAVSERNGSWLSPFYAGPSRELRPAYDYAHFVQVSLLTGAVVALSVIAVLLLGLFWIRPRDTGHGWFAAATLCWALYNWGTLEPRILMSNVGLWFSLPVIALGWFTIFSAHFVNRLPGCERPPPVVERALRTFGVTGSLMLIAESQGVAALSWVQAGLWLPGAVLISAYIVGQLLRATLRCPGFEVKLWLVAGVLALVVGARDYLWTQDVLTAGTFLYLSYTVSFVLIALALTLLSRVSRALTETETLNRELEDRVAARSVDIANNFARLQTLERERAIGAERERMLADMHDGIGGHLVHALAVVESKADFQPLEPILRGALDDLRLIFDSADPMDGDLLVVLSNFRARNERRAQAGGLTFVWQVTDLPALPDFGPHKILQVLRILQEALTNVLKHAHATQITVRTGTALDAAGRATVIVDVIDDGTGFVSGNAPGRGINNMRRRAQELGGSVELTATQPGSRLRLILPVSQ